MDEEARKIYENDMGYDMTNNETGSLPSHDNGMNLNIKSNIHFDQNEKGRITNLNSNFNENTKPLMTTIRSNNEVRTKSNSKKTDNDQDFLASSLDNRRAETLSTRLLNKLTFRGIGGKTINTSNDSNITERSPLLADFSKEQSCTSTSTTEGAYGTNIDPGDPYADKEKSIRGSGYDEFSGDTNKNDYRDVSKQNDEIGGNEQQIDTNDPLQRSRHFCKKNKRTKVEIDKIAMRNLFWSAILCTVFMIAELVGGCYAGSWAIQTDAAHLFADLIALGIAMSSIWISTKAPTDGMSYGYLRAEVIGAFVSVILIWVLNIALIIVAITQIATYGMTYGKNSYNIKSIPMLITSGVGVVINIVMGVLLHQPGHSHGAKAKNSSNTSAIETGEPVKKERMSISVSAMWYHAATDLFQSVLVFIAAIIIYNYEQYEIADPIATIIGAILVTGMTWPILKDVLNILMQGTPEGITVKDIDDLLVTVQGVYSSHQLRIWAITTDKFAVSGHIVISPDMDTQDILKRATQMVQGKYNFFDAALQVELPKEGGAEGECHMLCD